MAIDMKATDAALKSASKVEEGKAGSDVTAAATPINKWIIIGVTSVVLIGIIIGILFGTKVIGGGGGDATSGAQELSESDMNSLLNEAAQFNGDREIAEVVPTIPTTTTIAAPASTQAPKAPIVLNTSFRCVSEEVAFDGYDHDAYPDSDENPRKMLTCTRDQSPSEYL